MRIAFFGFVGKSKAAFIHISGSYGKHVKETDMRKLKKWTALTMCAAMLTCGSQAVYAATSTATDAGAKSTDTESATADVELVEASLPTGDLAGMKVITKEADDTSVARVGSYSYSEFYDWGNCASFYVYNKLTATQKEVWDLLYEQCNYYLNTMANYSITLSSGVTIGLLESLDVSDYGLSQTEFKNLYYLFKESNPQFYFLELGYSKGITSYGTTAGPGDDRNGGDFPDGGFIPGGNSTTVATVQLMAYANFADGYARYNSSLQLADKIDDWIASVSSCATDLEKEVALHDTICNNTTYDYEFIKLTSDTETEAYEQEHYTQSAYSAMLGTSTVCAGYAAAMELMCNAVDIDALEIISSSHAWTRVRLDGVWYNVDPTWDDQFMDKSYPSGYYKYFNISTATITSNSYESGNAHQQNSCYDTYMPSSVCAKDSTATASSYGTLAIADGTVDIEQAGFEIAKTDGTYYLSASNPDSSVTYFYLVDGGAASVQRASGIFSSKVSLGSKVSYVTVVGVRNDYRDSEVIKLAGGDDSSSADSGTGSGDTSTGSASESGTTSVNGSASESSSSDDGTEVIATPDGTTIKKVKKYKTKARIYIKPQKSGTTGYQIKYSKKKNFSSSKSVKISNTKSSVVIKNLKKGTGYYVKVRTYKKYKINGKTVVKYSSWSKKVSFKTKK